MWNGTWQTYSSVTQVVYRGAQELISKWKKKSYFADDVRVDYFSSLHCSGIWRTKPYCYSLVVWAKSVAPNLTYCKIFENFMGSYLMCTGFWNVKGATKASLLIPWQRSEWAVRKAFHEQKYCNNKQYYSFVEWWHLQKKRTWYWNQWSDKCKWV